MAKNSGGTKIKRPKAVVLGNKEEYLTKDIFYHKNDENGVVDEAIKDIGQSLFLRSAGATKVVEVKDLYPTQDTVNTSTVNAYMNKSVSGIQGVEVDGKVYVFDGHHRVAAEILKKKKSVTVNLVSVSNSVFEKKKRDIMEDWGWI